ncbi:MAG: hypothetical protein ACLQBQ_08060 [Smithella sp.]
MKKVLVLIMALFFAFGWAISGFAENEFQIKGVVAKINGNQITIKDDKGKEISLEGSLSDINVGDPILLNVQISKEVKMRTQLTAQEIEFLTKQCLIEQADVNIIPLLKDKDRGKLISWIDKRDCRSLDAFKASRAYYRKLKPNSAIPLAPAGWNIDYITDAEFQNYVNILNGAPW